MHPRLRPIVAALLPGMAALALAAPPSAAPPAEQSAFFETKVRPVLVESCASCHKKDSALGGLRVDSREALLAGGVSGPAIVPGDPARSLLLARIHGEGGKPRMPQGGQLAAEKTAALEAWIKMGAPWPAARPAQGQETLWWSLRPVQRPAPPRVKRAAWAKSPVDAFLLARMEAKGVQPAPPADRRTLIRRVTYDLTGLPPTYAEVQGFLADKAPGAYERVVDRLLASPRYGERWARLWLDIARYADTKGYVFNEDRNYYNAYTYRDWVIDAFNKDLPYDQFILHQLAADRLPPAEDKRPLAALGFLTVGRRFLNQEPDIIDDRIDVTMRGFQGLTVGCARCHDHKFDPVPIQDYYSLYSVFASSQETSPIISPREIAEPYQAHDARFQAAKNESERIIREETARLRERVRQEQAKAATVGAPLPEPVKRALQAVRENELPADENLKRIASAFPDERRQRLEALRAEQETLQKSYPPKPEFAMAMADKPQPVTVNVFKRGNPANPGDPAPRRFLRCVAGESRPEWTGGSGRLELAQAIADTKNPLTARVFVNRVWLLHFGAGLVRTPSDFGRQGEKPTHPELLDYLAWTFMHEDRWSIKKLHRRLLLTHAYQQSSQTDENSFRLDPENRLVCRMNRRRLDMEQLRDSLLAAAGTLDLSRVGGKSEEMWTGAYTRRRSVYGFIERQNLPQIFKTLDFATPDASSPQRYRTTVPQQALFLLNAPFTIDQVRALAIRSEWTKLADDASRVRALYLQLLGRLPQPEEAALTARFLAAPDPPAPVPTARIWQYGWGAIDENDRVTAFNELPHFAEGMWRGGPRLPDPALGWCLLTASGGHPGRGKDHVVIRRWTAPAEGTVSIRSLLKHPADQGDGVRALLIDSRRGRLAEGRAFHGETRIDLENLLVKPGDRIDFVVECLGSEFHDSFAWAPTLAFAGTKPQVFAAESDFAGPQPKMAPLSRWERLAQGLMMTNEFLFID